jgi:hypothetical protein
VDTKGFRKDGTGSNVCTGTTSTRLSTTTNLTTAFSKRHIADKARDCGDGAGDEDWRRELVARASTTLGSMRSTPPPCDMELDARFPCCELAYPM